MYGGCDGSENNFLTEKDCEETCVLTDGLQLLRDKRKEKETIKE